jgi:anaerobic selenocysteine-containing dehydrogenase
MERLSRRSFVKIAGAATGAAALAAAPPVARAAVGGDAENAEKIDPTTGVPEEPLVAYVRDAKRGEVTVTAGLTEHTYRDRALVKRLLRAAGKGE